GCGGPLPSRAPRAAPHDRCCSGEASESTHPDLALPSPHLLPRYGFMAAGGAGSVASGTFTASLPALPFSLLCSFPSSASACCSTSNSTFAASCAIIFSSLFRVSSGLNAGAAFTSAFLQQSCGCGVDTGREDQNRSDNTTATPDNAVSINP